jgi:formate dehydrogenase subunit gamma
MSHDPRADGTRHRWPDRAFHWIMAASVLVLAATAFLPIVGVRFDWVTIHWIAGVVLTAAVLFHILRAVFVQGLGEMLPRRDDLREVGGDLTGGAPDLKPAKFDAYGKGIHWLFAAIILALVGTGLLMLLKIDTPLWRRDPSILSDADWGIVYVIHGLTALASLFLVILHVYFAILPEHRALLRSMIGGRGPLHARGSPHDR